jgi:drug/metabolite transporter (DMT)-like permease
VNSTPLSTNGLGILAGLSTALLWTGTAVCFEFAARRLGSLAVNVLRLALALVLFAVLSLARTHRLWPAGLTVEAWSYLGLSGLVGFVVGDVMLFRAFIIIGARLSMLIYASVPFMTAVAGFAFLGETMSGRAVLGMAITVAGIALAVTGKRSPTKQATEQMATNATEQAPPSHAVGILMAFGGAAGQAAGLLLGKHGAVGLDSFSATQVRVGFGLGGFLLLAVLVGQAGTVLGLVRQAATSSMAADAARIRFLRRGLVVMALGSLLGPFLGVSLGLLSAQLLPTGMASTLMSTVPVLLIPVSALLFRESVSRSEIVGAVLAVAGVAVLAH